MRLPIPFRVSLWLVLGVFTGCQRAAPLTRQETLAAPVSRLTMESVGAYDKAVIKRIQDTWHRAMTSRTERTAIAGEFRISFKLHSDGNISDLTTVAENVPETLVALARDAVTKSAPFDPWPEHIRTLLGKDHRTVTFQFHHSGGNDLPGKKDTIQEK